MRLVAWNCEEVFMALNFGPDGFTLSFWQDSWYILKEEIMEMFNVFFGAFIRSVNTTFLVLIPKKGGTKDLKDFRSISLLGSLYKILSKVLANRLKKVVKLVVSKAQNAFVADITNASLIVNEVIDYW